MFNFWSARGSAPRPAFTRTTRRSAVVAFQDNNLKAGALDLHRRFPDRPIAILGDDDRHLPAQGLPNSGRVHATEAAKAVGGVAIFPRFKANEKGCDFTNFADVARSRQAGTGLYAVWRPGRAGPFAIPCAAAAGLWC